MRLPPGTRADAIAVLAAMLAAGALAVLTTISPQLGLTVSLLALVCGLHVARPAAAMVLVWIIWLVMPGVRRLFGLSGYLEADPLSIAPFLATGIVVVLQWSRRRQPRVVRHVVLLVAGGWLVGVPLGIVAGPEAALYNFVTYTVAAGGYIVGFNEPARRAGDLALVRALAIGAPLLAAYGLAQYLLPLTPWDEAWLRSVDIVTFGAPDGEHVRVFSTLNAPGVLAPVLGLALVWHLSRRRVPAAAWPVIGLLLFALALTYVRAAWLALMLGVLFAGVLGGRAEVARITAIAVGCVVIVLAAAPVSPTAQALADRFQTLGTLDSDVSANERASTSRQLIPESVTRPLGHGLGTAGEGSKLLEGGALRAPDNGYLSLLFQAGPVGALLVLAGLALAVSTALRRAWVLGRRRGDGAFIAGATAFVLVMLLSGDHFYGVVGVMFWYLLGAAGGALWREEPTAQVSSAGSPDSWDAEPSAPLAGERRRAVTSP